MFLEHSRVDAGGLACRECILAVAERRASCPQCREAITVEILHEGALPTAEHREDAAAIAEEVAAVQAQGRLATGGNPGGYPGASDGPRVLFESMLDAALKDVSPDSCFVQILLSSAAA